MIALANLILVLEFLTDPIDAAKIPSILAILYRIVHKITKPDFKGFYHHNKKDFFLENDSCTVIYFPKLVSAAIWNFVHTSDHDKILIIELELYQTVKKPRRSATLLESCLLTLVYAFKNPFAISDV